ncbi:hypothetical protein LDO31_18785 [Luteimonas sp. XNQY3]|nr:hypothetical protein [Luteimonas sp. XNQY3]MCD9008238.1 hypothetical protein [Luteimonas sp. XNQY3]
MAVKCIHYAHLVTRFRELCEKFVNAEVQAELADLANFAADLDRIAAFRLLFHAEVETFLEEKARERLLGLEEAISGGSWHRNNPHLLSLYLVCGSYIQDSEDRFDSDLQDHFRKVISAARKRIKENNGIKAQAFAFLSVSAGKSLDEIDATTSAMLNSFGKDRGEVAHNSAARSRTISAPSVERSNAAEIVNALSSYFDVEE